MQTGIKWPYIFSSFNGLWNISPQTGDWEKLIQGKPLIHKWEFWGEVICQRQYSLSATELGPEPESFHPRPGDGVMREGQHTNSSLKESSSTAENRKECYRGKCKEDVYLYWTWRAGGI